LNFYFNQDGEKIYCHGKLDNKGLRDGYWYFTDESQKLRREGYYFQGKKHSEWKRYSKDDQKLVHSTFYRFGLKHGSFRSYYDNGNMHIKGFYKKNEAHGKWIEYTFDGKLKRTEQYLHDVKHGAEEIYRDGEKVWTNYFNNGDPIGMYRIYRFNELIVEGEYNDGLRTDEWKYYHDTGELGAYGSYLLNEMHDKWYFLDKAQNINGWCIMDSGVMKIGDGEFYTNEEAILDFCNTLYI
jgi:antitoxin component YwqK of YwqJK toxin-antitoxin module